MLKPLKSSVPVFIIVVGTLIFAALSQLIGPKPGAVDVELLQTLESARSPIWTSIMLGITRVGRGECTIFVVVALVLWILLRLRAPREALFLAAVNIGTSILSPTFKHLIERPRPTPDVVAAITNPQSFSFPSGHAMSAMVFYTSLALVARHLSPLLYPYALALAAFMIPVMGFTRMYLGVHYTTDVVAGWSMGAAWVWLCYFVYSQSYEKST